MTPRTRDAVHAALDAARSERLTRNMLCAIEARGTAESALRWATGTHPEVCASIGEESRRNGALELATILDGVALDARMLAETRAGSAVRDRVASVVTQVEYAAARVRAEYELEAP